MASTSAEVTVLPRYFPTYVKHCQAPAEAFFKCFETKAVMKHDKDTESPRTALRECQAELAAYTTCQAKYIDRPWWKLW